MTVFIATRVTEGFLFMVVVFRVCGGRIQLTVLQREAVGSRKLPDYGHLVCKDPAILS